MTDEEREAFAERLRQEVARRFGGVALRAYTAAGVNSATWDRAVNAESIKPSSVHKIVSNLWPETDGDWTRIPAVGASVQDHPGYVSAPGERVESGITNDDLFRELLRQRAEYDQLRAEVRAVSERVARLEPQQGPESLGGAGGTT